MPMKKCKKIISAIITVCILVFVAIAALDFMGVINLGSVQTAEDGDGTGQVENEISAAGTEPWHIVFKGYAFSVRPIGTAIIHESGCLNIRSCDEYLIQINVEDKTVADFWDNRKQLKENIEDAGYVMELDPEKFEINGKEYLRYIVSLEGERGADFDASYFYQLICDAGKGQRIFTSIRFDGIDIDAMSKAERDAIYEKAAYEAANIISKAVPTDETNDMTGSYWQTKEAIETEIVDSIADGDTSVSYELPEGYSLMNEDLSGKTYYSDVDKITVVTSVVPYTWMTAADMAGRKTGAGISNVVDEGQREVNGMTFYYYTYSVLYIKNGKRSLTYNFAAYADLKNGDIYTINSFADDNPDVMEPGTYYNFMDIKEE